METYNFTATNANGLLTVEIGSGNPVLGTSFSSIYWASGPFFLNTEIDPNGGTNYTITGQSQILSVPYALYAKEAGSVSETDPVFGTSPSKGITYTNLANWNAAFSWGDHAAEGYAMDTHTHSSSDITSGTMAVARGGTGLSSYTQGYYIYAQTDNILGQRHPSGVLSDIGAVGTWNEQTISGDKTFSGNVYITNHTLRSYGGIINGFKRIQDVADPVDDKDAATKAYVDQSIRSYVDDALRALKLVPENYAGIVTDIDGNSYTTVAIGSQTWMAQNLKVTHYRDGTPIPREPDPAAWSALRTGAYIEYDLLNVLNAGIYGLLYNFYAVADPRNLCPAGWHVPTHDEYSDMEAYLAGASIAGGKLKETGTTHWQSPNEGATNETGFTALPGGARWGNGAFGDINQHGYWWTSSQPYDETAAYNRTMTYLYTWIAFSTSYKKWNGFSVRCVKD